MTCVTDAVVFRDRPPVPARCRLGRGGRCAERRGANGHCGDGTVDEDDDQDCPGASMADRATYVGWNGDPVPGLSAGPEDACAHGRPGVPAPAAAAGVEARRCRRLRSSLMSPPSLGGRLWPGSLPLVAVEAPLRITKRASPTHVQSGSTVSFTIRVTNQSGTRVRDVSVCDRLPTGLVHVSGGTLHGTEVCWKVESLAARHSRTFVVRARATASHTTVVTNLATVRARGAATRSARATFVIINPMPTFTG
jgi:uncharacterized repeat protein (TIGR01451 family)